ncbi:MAG: hypothetical protein KDD10_01335 [Phaeodactylibacter sp.]|nr:hypothetical protein [Phaeodactylibacter sp.]MCB9293597.1 hypothetical protein [Lewinellaceae bacterium]
MAGACSWPPVKKWKITGEKAVPYYNIRYNNGEKFYDGNPILSALADGRLLRIIQEEPESQRIFLRASLEKRPEDEIDELVIILELSQEAKPLLEELIRKWLVEKEEKEAMGRFIRERLRNVTAQPEA